MMRTTRRRTKFIVLILSLVAAAAGGDALRAQEPQAQQKLLSLQLTPVLVTVLRLPNWVALSEGIYTKNGLDVDQCVPAGDVRDLKRILGVDTPSEYRCKPGRAQSPVTIGGGLPGSFMSAFETGTARPRSVILATVQNRTNYVMIARKDITRPEQLRGKTIG